MVWDVDEVMFTLWGRDIYWYGFSWFLAMAVGTFLFYLVCRREGYSDRLLLGIFLTGYFSPVIGARLGHCFFYEWDYYSVNPARIMDFAEGGMASHGAALGLLAGLAVFSLTARMPYIWALDRIMLPVTIGGAFVRLGNLMNSEIYGKETGMPWGLVFVRNGESVPKHPTQVYEAICYVFVFGVIAWLYFRRDAGVKRPGLMFGTGLVGIFLPRLLIEFIKNPQVGFEESMCINMGQWLSLPFIVMGIIFIWISLRRPKAVNCK